MLPADQPKDRADEGRDKCGDRHRPHHRHRQRPWFWISMCLQVTKKMKFSANLPILITFKFLLSNNTTIHFALQPHLRNWTNLETSKMYVYQLAKLIPVTEQQRASRRVVIRHI